MTSKASTPVAHILMEKLTQYLHVYIYFFRALAASALRANKLTWSPDVGPLLIELSEQKQLNLLHIWD